MFLLAKDHFSGCNLNPTSVNLVSTAETCSKCSSVDFDAISMSSRCINTNGHLFFLNNFSISH